MSNRLQVLIPSELDAEVRKAAQRLGVSTGEYVRRALRQSLPTHPVVGAENDPLARLAALSAPTADIDDMLAEIERGRF